ncbi:MAG: FAD:protein FMN transferase [Bacteroidales bacterium]|nr:FAD:protein FMN transferase [Bacteroidales bacterium]
MISGKKESKSQLSGENHRGAGGLRLGIAVASFAILLSLNVFNACTQKGYVQIGGYAQGGTWSVKYNADGVKASPAEVQKGVEAILADIDRTLSGYNKGSELSRLNAGDTIRPSAMLIGMYNRSRSIWERTEGAVDVAAGPLFDAWGFGFKSGVMPTEEQIAAAMAVSGMGRLVPRMEDALLPDGRLCAARLLAGGTARTAQLATEEATPVSERESAPESTGKNEIPQLNFNAVAQGYSCDTVAAYLAKLGVRDMLVDIGEILCLGLNPSGKPWRIGVDRPTDGNNSPGADLDGFWESAGWGKDEATCVEDGCQAEVGAAGKTGAGRRAGGFQGIVTSGNYRKYYVRDGIKYSHTIDPRTGRPAENSLLSATVVAPSAEEADAFATYLMVIGLEKAKAFVSAQPELEAYLIYSLPEGSAKENLKTGTADSDAGKPGKKEAAPQAAMAEWSSERFNLR